jgi:hypothetical protein
MPLSAVLLFVVGISPATHPQSVSNDTYGGPDVLAIYRKLLPSRINGKTSLLVSTTRAARMCDDFTVDRKTPSSYREAISDFRSINLRVHDLRSLLGAENISLITEQELHSFFVGGLKTGWERFHRTHPNAAGYYAFSAIGFDKTRTLAAVYEEGICGTLCGSGRIRFIKRGPDGWNEVKPPFETCEWIS